MRFAILLATISFALSVPGMAQFRTIAEAYEVRLSDLRLPQSEGGTVAYKTCDACAYESKLVSDDMQWILDGRSLPFEDFRRGVATVSDRENTPVMVLHHLESDRVTRVSVHPVAESYDWK
jgi:hypothetical protein